MVPYPVPVRRTDGELRKSCAHHERHCIIQRNSLHTRGRCFEIDQPVSDRTLRRSVVAVPKALLRQAIDEVARKRIETTYRDLCMKGYRVLAVAYAKVPAKDVYGTGDETGLMLAGFLTFSDPPLATAKSTVCALQQDGIQVKILTGDSRRGPHQADGGPCNQGKKLRVRNCKGSLGGRALSEGPDEREH